MRNRLLAAAILFALAGCGGTAPEPRPPWLLQLIETHGSEPVANPPTQIIRREYESGVFYYVPPRCCDIWSDLYDADGALVCHPDGGITGNGDGNCPALGDPLREEVVWRDPRD